MNNYSNTNFNNAYNSYLPYNNNLGQWPTNNIQPAPQYYPQPQGVVYTINNAAEISNIPVNNNSISIALIPNESIAYVKTLQNDIPVINAYELTPLNSQENINIDNTNTINDADIKNLLNTITNIENKVKELEFKMNSMYGGRNNDTYQF